jgi:hypothetical protein
MESERFSMYFETEEDFIEWQKREAESKTRWAADRLAARILKAERAARRPEFGTWHTIAGQHKAVKVRDGDTVSWQKEPITESKGMYIGYRYKFEGEWKEELPSYYEPAEGHYFSQSKTVEVWVFVLDERRKPTEVFPFEIE